MDALMPMPVKKRTEALYLNVLPNYSWREMECIQLQLEILAFDDHFIEPFDMKMTMIIEKSEN